MQMRLSRPIARTDEVDQPALLVDAGDVFDHPLATGQLLDQSAILAIEVEVLKATALGCPDEAAMPQWLEHIVQIDPDSIRLAQQHAPLARLAIELHQVKRCLRAVLNLRHQAAVGKPLHSRKIDIGVVAKIQPNWLPGRS